MKTKKILVSMILCALITAAGYSDCPFAHTHIGINPTWQPDWSSPGDAGKSIDTDPTDNNKLWFFSLPPVHATAPTPGWPRWEHENGNTFLLITPYLDGGQRVSKGDGSDKELWVCNFHYSKAEGYNGSAPGRVHIDGWHSAHGPQGKWNLESIDEAIVPDWDIYIRRQSSSIDEDDFFMMLSDYTPVLTSDGDIYRLEKSWLADKNAWGFHIHMGFYFWLAPDFDEEVSVTFSAFDAGGMYERSADFTMKFAKEICVPQQGDLNNDCLVDLADLAMLAANWLKDTSYGQDDLIVPHN